MVESRPGISAEKGWVATRCDSCASIFQRVGANLTVRTDAARLVAFTRR